MAIKMPGSQASPWCRVRSDDLSFDLRKHPAAARHIVNDPTRVLIVEDDPDFAEVLSMLVEANGYEVQVAHAGAEALRLVEAAPPHCILLDVRMPGLDGDQLSRRIRELHGDDIVLIAVTGGGPDDARVSRVFGRVDHYLHKPIDPTRLAKVLPPLDRPA